MIPRLEFGFISIPTYGLSVALGVLLAIALLRKMARQRGWSADGITDVAMIIAVCGFGGARLFYVIQEWDYFARHPLDIFALWQGGIVFYGGMIGGLVGTFVGAKIKHIPFWQLLDTFMPAVALAQGFGRIGCFLNGCCYGISQVPVQLLESGYCFLLSGFLFLLHTKRPNTGTVSAGYFFLYPLGRFVIEFWRGDHGQYNALTLAQWISVGTMAITFILWFLYVRKNSHRTA